MRCLGAVLAGGEARRFGGKPKGLVVVDGATMLDRVRAALEGACDGAPVLVTRPGAPGSSGIAGWRVVHDGRDGAGPLAGIEAALQLASDEGADGALVVAWDMPWLTAELLRFVREAGERTGSAVVPQLDGRLEPFCAWYPAGALTSVSAALDARVRAPRHWIATLPNVVRPDAAALAPYGNPARLLASINSPADLPDPAD